LCKGYLIEKRHAARWRKLKVVVNVRERKNTWIGDANVPAVARKIALYNHKGGVGKTTLIMNIAAALGESGKKVLLVDTDPQCNLTSYLVEDAVVDGWLDGSDDVDGRTIWTSLKPIVEGIGDIRPTKLHETYLPNTSLVPGDIRLAEYERNLDDFWRDCLERRTRGYRAISSLSRLTADYGKKQSFDYIFFDTGPNIGPLNRQILLDMDFIVVPVACDLFSLRALKTLGRTLADWIKTWQSIESLAPDDVSLLKGRPQFLGYIPQRFRVYGGDLASPARFYFSRLEKGIYSDVVQPLRQIDHTLAPRTLAEMRLGEVQDLQSLVPISQQQGLPLWKVTEGNAGLKAKAKSAFHAIALKLGKAV